MSALAAKAGSSLEWTQPSAFKMEFELHADGQPVGSLRFRSSFGTHAVAEIGGRRWTFKRVGFWQQKVSVREDGAEVDLAEFANNTWHSGGELRCPDGRVFRATSNFWSSKLAWRDASEAEVALLEHGGFLRLHSRVTIPAGLPPEVPVDLLVPLGLYLVVMLQRDSASAAAVTAAG